MMRRSLLLVMFGFLVLLTGCAELTYTMRFDVDKLPGAESKVWPAAPEIPRYRYVGQLTGEDNFIPDAADTRKTGIELFRWLVGLVGMNEQKVTLKRPQSGLSDADGRTYITDIGNPGVYVFDQAAGKLLVWKMARQNVRFVTPIGIAQGKNKQILVADADLGRVFRLDHDGNAVGDFGGDVLKRPTGLARDPLRGWIYVADTHAHDVKVFNDEGQLLKVIGHRGDGNDEDEKKNDGELNFPTHVTFGAGKLYVTDTMNARVQIFDAHGKPLGSLGKRGLNVGDFVRPKGVALDSDSNLYVVESYYDHLLVFNDQGHFLLPIGGTGGGVGQFYLPAGLWSDHQGRIYLADMFNGRVAIFQYLGDQ